MDIYDNLLDEQTPQAAQPTTAQPDVYDGLLDDVQASQRKALDVSLDQALKVMPDKAATSQQLMKATGLPQDVIDRNFDAVQKQVRLREMQSLLTSSPILARQVSDANFAKLAQDDLESLSLIERIPRQFAGGGVEMIGRTVGGVGQLIDVAQRNTLGAFASVFLPEPVGEIDPSSLTGPLLGEDWRRVGDAVKDVGRDIQIPALQQTFVDQVAAGVGQVGAQVLATLLTGGALSTASLYAQGADAMAEKIAGDDASQGAKDLAVLGGAALTGITEKWALDKILGPMAVPIQNQVGAALARIGIAGASEGAQEAIESIGQDVIRQYLTNPEADIQLGQAFEEAQVGAAVGVIVRGIVEAAVGVRNRHARLEQNAEQAETNALTLEQLNQVAAASQLLARSPETFEQFINAAAEDGPVQAVYIDAQTLMQSGVAEQLAQLSPAVAEQLAVAVATGGTIQIPLGEYAAKIAPTEFAQGLLDNLKTDPQGFSRNEAREYLQTQQQQLEEEVAQQLADKADDAVFMESQQKVKDLVLSELNALGRFTPQKNEFDATLIAARTAVRASQLGMTPEDFFEKQRLNFAAERIDGDQFNQEGELQTDTEAFRNWFGDSKVADEDGKPLVVYHGSENPNITEFDTTGESSKTASKRIGTKGAYFTKKPMHSDAYAGPQGSVYPVYLSIKNPLVVTGEGVATTGIRGLLNRLVYGRDKVELESNLDRLRMGATQYLTDGDIDALRAAGYDGIINDDASEIIVFEPTQIKSAVGNRGTFDPNDPNILLQSNPVVDPERNLFVAHNIRPEGILAAADLGGLAAPSIAVARADIGFDNFGDVTLIADPSLLTSAKVRTFDADIYSPRQPRAEYDINEKKWWTFSTELEANGLGLSRPDINSVERDGPQAMLQSDAVRYLFLKEQGKLPKMKQRQVEPAIKQAAKLTGDRWALIEDPKFLAIATKRYQEYVRQAEASDPVRGEKYTSLFFEADGTLQRSTLTDFARKVVDYRDSGGKDVSQFRNDLNAKLRDGKLAADYQKWVEDKFNAMVDGKQIFKGFTNSGNRKYLPYTLENVVKEMTQSLQAGEGSFYGAGSVRSSVANEMKTIEQVQARRKQIVSEADLEKVKEESNQKLEEALEALKPFYRYDTDGWGYFNDAGAAIAEGPKAQREAFKITAQSQKIIDDLLTYLRALPTAYFEAKAQRAVQFSEFNTAVVPKGMRKDALQVLKDAGLKIKTYDPQTEGDRARIVSAQSKLLFQGQQAPRGSFNPNTNTIAMLKGADLSTFLHEAGHYFFESDIALAAEIAYGNRMFGASTMTEGEQQILKDVSALLKWHGFEGDIDAQLAQWNGLSFEEKRVAHERTAESFEAYLFEGKAPSIELQPYFQKFREWLLSVYTSLKAFITNNPEAGTLTDEVRAVFDRMLATTEQIQLAEQGRSMMPLFRTQAEADNVGMTPQEFAAYQAQDPQATNDAIKDLEAKGLRDLQWTRNARNKQVKKLQREARELRKEAADEARAQVVAEPVYKAWRFLTGKMTEGDTITPFKREKSDPNVVDPTQDSLFTAIAKLGGLNKDELVATWGIDPAERPSSGVFGKPVLRKEGGRTVDGIMESLVEQGYLSTDENGKADLAEFEEKFDNELRGDPQYSVAYDYGAAEAEATYRAGEGVDITALGAGRLDLDSLYEMDITQTEIDLLKARRMVAKNGLHPDLVAELPGIEMTSGNELVRKLIDATPLKEEIDARAETIMLERHGELATPQAIEREADKAILNEARARMIATEANALARATGQRKILAAAAKQLAQGMVARIKVRDVKPSKYASAEARAAKAAVKASRAGDLAQAAAEKRTQLVNAYAARAAYDALDDVAAGVRYLKKFEREGSRKGLDFDYLEQIDTLLERFDLRTGQSLKAIDKRTNLAAWIAAQEQAGLEPSIPDYILAEANRTSYKNLTVEEFKGLVDSVKQIEHLGRLKKKLLTAKDQRELDAIVDDIRTRMEDASDGRVVDNERRDTLASRVEFFGRWINSAHRKAGSVVRELDGFQDGGPMWNYFLRTMNEAGDREAVMRADASQRLHELAKPVLDGESMGGKGRWFPSLNRSLNRGERLAMALNWGNESNRQRLLGGKGWTQAQVQPVLSTLTAAEWTFVQGVWDFFESYRPEIAAKELRVYGKEPDWIDPAPFEITTADGQVVQVRGGYYPVKYDPQQSGKAGEFAEAEDAKAMMRAAYTAATTRRSFTKGRAEEVQGRPLLLTFDGIWQGANEVIHDLTWHEWLIDANRLLKRLDSTIRNGFGAEYVDVLRKAVKDTARGDVPAANAVEKSLTHIRNGSTIVGMGWNVTTALMQPLGYANSIVRIGGKWMARGMSEFFGSPKHMIEKAEEVQAMSAMMRTRMLTMNREINDVRNRLVADRSELRERIEGSFFIMIQKLQATVDYPTWLGAYAKALSDPANDEARAIALADQAVIDAQGGGQIKDLAEVQRGHPVMKLFTNFYSYFNVLYNLTTEQTKKRVKAKEYGGLMGDYMLLMVVPAVMSAIIRNAIKGEDDEDEYAKAIASELVGYPFGMFVGVRELAGAMQLAAGVGNPAFGYSGPAGLRFFSEMNKLGVQVGQGELDMALFKSANNVAGLLFHYPAGQVNRMVDGTAALIDGETQNPLAPLVGVNRN